MHYEVKQIAGIDVIFGYLPDALSTTIEIMVKAGSIYETQKTNGLSHFLEHMFFKGGKKYPTPAAVAAAVDAFGGEFNAYTSEEYAGYYVKSAPEYLPQAIDVLADMLVHAQFPAPELEREKGVIIQEIKMYKDMPQRYASELWKNRFYGDNSFGRSILGPEENIKSFNQDHFFAHKHALYTKDNLVIVIAGKIENQAQIEDQLATLFKDLPATTSLQKPIYMHHIPREHQASTDLKTQQNHLIVSSTGRTIHDDLRYPAKLLATILGGSMSSRLFQEVREKRGLCYYVFARHEASDQEGAFYIKAGIEKGRWELGLETIYAELAKISSGDITDEEFALALGNTKGGLQMGLETSDEYASFLGYDWLFKKQIESLDDLLHAYEAVTKDQLHLVAKQLSADKLFAYRVE